MPETRLERIAKIVHMTTQEARKEGVNARTFMADLQSAMELMARELPAPAMTPENLKEMVLAHVVARDPDLRSPYAIDGNPPMWIIGHCANGTEIAARPARAQERIGHRWEEVNGVAYQLRQNDAWIGQGMKGSWSHFAEQCQTWQVEFDDVFTDSPSIDAQQVGVAAKTKEILAVVNKASQEFTDEAERSRFLQNLQLDIEAIPGAWVAFETRSTRDYVDESMGLKKAHEMLNAAADRYAEDANGVDSISEIISEVRDSNRAYDADEPAA